MARQDRTGQAEGSEKNIKLTEHRTNDSCNVRAHHHHSHSLLISIERTGRKGARKIKKPMDNGLAGLLEEEFKFIKRSPPTLSARYQAWTSSNHLLTDGLIFVVNDRYLRYWDPSLISLSWLASLSTVGARGEWASKHGWTSFGSPGKNSRFSLSLAW